MSTRVWVWLAVCGGLLYPAVLVLGLVLGASSGRRDAAIARDQLSAAMERADKAEKSCEKWETTANAMLAGSKAATQVVADRQREIAALTARVAELENSLKVANSLAAAVDKQPTKRVLTGEKWTQIAHWSGTGDKTTESFDLPAGRARVRWSTVSTKPDVGLNFTVYVYPDDGSESYVESASKDEQGEEITYIRSRPGKHYVKISSLFAEWDVTVELPE